MIRRRAVLDDPVLLFGVLNAGALGLSISAGTISPGSAVFGASLAPGNAAIAAASIGPGAVVYGPAVGTAPQARMLYASYRERVALRGSASDGGGASISMIATETWTGTDGAAWPSQWITAAAFTGTVTIQGNAGEMRAQGAAYAPANALLTSMPAISDTDVLLRFTQSNPAGEQYSLVWLRHGGAWQADGGAAVDGYWFEIGNTGAVQSLALYKNVGSVRTTLSSAASTPITWGTATWWLRAQAAGTAIRARVWADGNPEPATWNISVTDSSLASGKAAFSAYNGNASTARTFTVDDLLLTDGAPPKGKALNASYRARVELRGNGSDG